ncbi:MAG: HAMP domain-containing sensor histidine kinase [Candidatus Eisenbacteria bacterium]
MSGSGGGPRGGASDVALVHAGGSLSGRLGARSGTDVVINLPLLGADSDSFLAVQVRYPLDAIQAELENQRKRGLLWLGTVLGVGVLGAFLVAGQFTRPIRALQASFRKVEEGDLSVHVEPRRGDEIGRLTGSFNEMVDRLRESREVETRLGEAERLASVGRLAAGVAHEIRNPLNAIQLTALQMRDVALRGAETSSPTGVQLERYYQLVSNEVKRLERLVSAFLDLAREESLSRLRIDGAASLEASVELFRREAAHRSVTIELASPGAVPLLADPTRLPAVWNNLLSNALAASPDGGTIRVDGHVERGSHERTERPTDGEGARTDSPDANEVMEPGAGDGSGVHGPEGVPTFVVTVRDEGPGVSPEDRTRVWDPFFSGRESGTGLGLSIVRAVVERHGGGVRVLDSERGAAFEIRLPMEPEMTSGSGGGAAV